MRKCGYERYPKRWNLPGKPIGGDLIWKGEKGFVVDYGYFLQDILIYSVYFENDLITGCCGKGTGKCEESRGLGMIEFTEEAKKTLGIGNFDEQGNGETSEGDSYLL